MFIVRHTTDASLSMLLPRIDGGISSNVRLGGHLYGAPTSICGSHASPRSQDQEYDPRTRHLLDGGEHLLLELCASHPVLLPQQTIWSKTRSVLPSAALPMVQRSKGRPGTGTLLPHHQLRKILRAWTVVAWLFVRDRVGEVSFLILTQSIMSASFSSSSLNYHNHRCPSSIYHYLHIG